MLDPYCANEVEVPLQPQRHDGGTFGERFGFRRGGVMVATVTAIDAGGGGDAALGLGCVIIDAVLHSSGNSSGRGSFV